MLYLHALTLSLITGIIVTDLTLQFQYYFFYAPVLKILFLLSLGSFFFGNLAGRLILSKIGNSRVLSILVDLLMLMVFTLYLVKPFFGAEHDDLFLALFFYNPYLYVLYIGIAFFLTGMKSNYLVKTACGDFIDDRQAIIVMAILILTGFPAGSLLAAAAHVSPWLFYAFIILPFLLIPAAVLNRLQYNPAPQFAKEFEREADAYSQDATYRDFLIFTYLDFALIVLYLYLCQLSMDRYNGSFSVYTMLFYVSSLLLISLGFIIGGFIRKNSWHVYGQIFLPVTFITCVFFLYNFHYYSIFVDIMILSPVFLVSGFVLRHTINNIIINHKHAVRFRILEFSLFILPPPIILSLLLINFTNLWFYIVTYAAAFISILIPGLHLLSTKSKGYKKIVYFIFTLVIIPSLIAMHLLFNIPLDGNIYAAHTENFNVLKSVNYNSLYIRQYDTVKMHSFPVFTVSDSIIRNMKRSLIPPALYLGEKDTVLFIDSNQRFFQNPVIGMYREARCVDPMQDVNVDFNRIPLTGRQTYEIDNEDLLLYFKDLEATNKKFNAIIDVPNIMDQQVNQFRFTDGYYATVEKNLSDSGIFGQVFALQKCRAEYFTAAVHHLKKRFRRHAVYLFSDYCLILASNNDKAFEINTERYNRFGEFLKQEKMPQALFLNQIHVLSHLAFLSLEDLEQYLTVKNTVNVIPLSVPKLPAMKIDVSRDILGKESMLLKSLPGTFEEANLRMTITAAMAANKTGIELLHGLEYAESIDDYENETRYLFELQKYIPYRDELKEYVSQVFSYKEKYYYNTALRFERDKKWDDAKKLYNVVLSMNSENFDANYRMGVLSVTLQDIPSSFKYFSNAMKIQNNHPKVLYQMGVLYFMTNKTNEAVNYFHKAIEQKETNPTLLKYLAICYDKQGNLPKAEEYFTKALIGDPNDNEAKDLLKALQKKKEVEMKKWETEEPKNDNEVEQGINIPLPINKSAYDIRIKDNDTSLPVVNSKEHDGANVGK